jgi:hypothetical protein
VAFGFLLSELNSYLRMEEKTDEEHLELILENAPIATQLLDYAVHNSSDLPICGHVAAAQAIK